MRLGAIRTNYTTEISKSIYNSDSSEHRFRHRYVINYVYINTNCVGLSIDGMSESAKCVHRTQGLVSNISIGDYNIVGVQYHPELSPRPDPIFKWFLL